MREQQRIVLVGDSLFMDAVEASLGKNQDLGVTRIHTNSSDVKERLKSLHPDLIIFDWDTPHSQFVLPFLREQPSVPLLAVDINCSKVVALNGHQYTTPTVNDLTQVIQIQTSSSNGNGRRAQLVPTESADRLSAVSC